MEFKVVDGVDKFGEEEGINRIILEFKERMNLPDGSSEIVLIESYWNLKNTEFELVMRKKECINRIILEFKGPFQRTDWRR